MRQIIFSIFLLVGLLSSCGSEQQKNNSSSINETAGSEGPTADSSKKTILFFGNSLTAGYGLEMNEAFPALIQDKIDSLDLPYRVVNAGLSGETTASGNSRVEWVLQNEVDIFILELGGNDGLRGISTEETRKNLISIIEKVRQENPEVQIILAGMQIPPNMGEDYASKFRKVFPEVAEEKNTALIPFLLKDVGGMPELNQSDGIHPTAEGHKIVAETVWQVLKPLL